MPDEPLGTFGWLLVIAGAGLALLGILILVAGRIPWLGNLPGDVQFSGDNWTVYLPLGTMIVLSILLSIALTVILRLLR